MEDEQEYHVDRDGEFILDDRGEKIPNYVCICAARSVNECGCGAWYVPLPGECREVDDDY